MLFRRPSWATPRNTEANPKQMDLLLRRRKLYRARVRSAQIELARKLSELNDVDTAIREEIEKWKTTKIL